MSRDVQKDSLEINEKGGHSLINTGDGKYGMLTYNDTDNCILVIQYCIDRKRLSLRRQPYTEAD